MEATVERCCKWTEKEHVNEQMTDFKYTSGVDQYMQVKAVGVNV